MITFAIAAKLRLTMLESKLEAPRLWIASFPRSGNTFFRNVLSRVYRMPSESFFVEPGRPVSPNLRDFPALKTHELPGNLPEGLRLEQGHVAVYLIRDGRDALVSAAHHRRSFAEPASDFEVNLLEAIMAPGNSFFGGGWSQHVEKWTAAAAVVIRFEDLIADPIGQVERLRPHFDLPEPHPEALPTFAALRSGDADYGANPNTVIAYNSKQEIAEHNFRRGKVGSWRDEMPADLHELFWMVHGKAMDAWGYGEGERPGLAQKNLSKKRFAVQVGNIQDPARDGTWRYSIELINGLHAFLIKMPERFDIELILKGGRYVSLREYHPESQNLYEFFAAEDRRGGAIAPPPEVAEISLRLNNWEQFVRHRSEKWPKKMAALLPSGLRRKFLAAWDGPRIQRQRNGLELRWQSYRAEKEVALSRWDLLHILLPQFAPASEEIRTKWLVTCHDLTTDLFPEYHHEDNIKIANAGLKLCSMRQADFMTISVASREDLMRLRGVPGSRIHLASEGANWDLFRPTKDPGRLAEVQAQLNLPQGKPFFMVLNTLEPRKNLEGTLRAFLKLVETPGNAEVQLVICGAVGWKMEHLALDDQRRHPNLHFVGFVDDPDLPVLYTHARALCYLSFYEGFGLPPLEAMACGTPVISSNVSSMPEVAGDGGLLVDPRDDDAIAAAMQQLLDDDVRDALAAKARAQAHRFSWLKMAWQTLRTYLTIAAQDTFK